MKLDKISIVFTILLVTNSISLHRAASQMAHTFTQTESFGDHTGAPFSWKVDGKGLEIFQCFYIADSTITGCSMMVANSDYGSEESTFFGAYHLRQSEFFYRDQEETIDTIDVYHSESGVEGVVFHTSLRNVVFGNTNVGGDKEEIPTNGATISGIYGTLN